jgi:hypothetical protein
MKPRSKNTDEDDKEKDIILYFFSKRKRITAVQTEMPRKHRLLVMPVPEFISIFIMNTALLMTQKISIGAK